MRRRLGLFLVALLLVPSPATAHTSAVDTSPDDGAQLETLPADAMVTFSDEPEQADVVLATPDGDVRTLEPLILGSVVKVRLPTNGPRGDYKLSYRVVSADGHPVSGSVAFSVTQGPAPATTRPAPTSSTSTPARGWLVPMVIGLAALGFVGMVLVARSMR